MKNLFSPPKFVDFTIQFQGWQGYSSALMDNFMKSAKVQGWSGHDINIVIAECMKSDYSHLIETLEAHQIKVN